MTLAAVEHYDGQPVAWRPHDGAQQRVLSCPYWEVLVDGPRGSGKSDVVVMSYAQFVDAGWGEHWRGIIFRRTYKELTDLIARTKRWFSRIFGDRASYNGSEHTWSFEGGEELLLRQLMRPDDYEDYHGHEYPFIGWEELTNWTTSTLYTKMLSCSRSSTPDMPRIVRSNTNSWGPGRAWVKARFIDPMPIETPFGREGLERVRIFCPTEENKTLMAAQPLYVDQLRDSITDPELARAWIDGDWDVAIGSMFADVWDANYHVVEPFDIPISWRVDRSFDWGSSKPFACLWWAESNGDKLETPVVVGGRRLFEFPKGTLFLIREWYGAKDGEANVGLRMPSADIAMGIKERERVMRDDGVRKIVPGPADLPPDPDRGPGVAGRMAKRGVRWLRVTKGAGSRVAGWDAMRDYLSEVLVLKDDERGLENPALFVWDICRHTIALLPEAPRDEKNLDDIDTDSEDHIPDAARYRIAHARVGGGVGSSDFWF